MEFGGDLSALFFLVKMKLKDLMEVHEKDIKRCIC